VAVPSLNNRRISFVPHQITVIPGACVPEKFAMRLRIARDWIVVFAKILVKHGFAEHRATAVNEAAIEFVSRLC